MSKPLSLEFFFPDCPECGASGDLNVVRERGGPPRTRWECLVCKTVYDDPPQSKWYGVSDLPEIYRRAYTMMGIRGVSPNYYAQTSGVTSTTAEDYLKKARKQLGKIRNGARPPPASAD